MNELDNVGGERSRSGSAAEEGPVVRRGDRRRTRGRAGSRCGHSGEWVVRRVRNVRGGNTSGGLDRRFF